MSIGSVGKVNSSGDGGDEEEEEEEEEEEGSFFAYRAVVCSTELHIWLVSRLRVNVAIAGRNIKRERRRAIMTRRGAVDIDTQGLWKGSSRVRSVAA